MLSGKKNVVKMMVPKNGFEVTEWTNRLHRDKCMSFAPIPFKKKKYFLTQSAGGIVLEIPR